MRSKQPINELYRKRAGAYDISANVYYLIGFREFAYRKRAVEALNAKPGDTLVEIGCGTGLNFSLVQQKIGPTGKIVGVDLTDKMLDRARSRVERSGWKNVQLVQSDASSYKFPCDVAGIISTFAITLVPEFDQVIKRGANALSSGGRFVILDLKKPEGFPLALVRLGVLLTKPFGVSLDLMDRHPWESVRKYLREILFADLYNGFAYISAGEAY